jgi:urease accessory protein
MPKVQHSIMTITTEVAGVARLLMWLSPAFPTGGFAYSHGLEQAVEAGYVRDETTLIDWLATILSVGAGRSDAILLRHAHSANEATLQEIAELAEAACSSRERRAETLAQGSAFIAALASWPCPSLVALAARIGAERIAYPVAVGAACAAHDVCADAATLGYLTAFFTSLISAGVRLIPLGQNAGLRVLAGLEPKIMLIAEETRSQGLDDVASASFRVDIASMRHETQYARLFRS